MSYHHLMPYNAIDIVILYQSYGLLLAENNIETPHRNVEIYHIGAQNAN